MAKKCYQVRFVNCAGGTDNGQDYVCSNLLEFKPGGNCSGPYLSDAEGRFNVTNASVLSGSVTIVSCANCPGCCPDPSQPCDCINGGCVPKTTYNTPGVFPNLAACESGCAKNSNCTGECVDPAEIAAHQQAINILKTKIC